MVEQQEQRWARRWTWVVVGCSILNWCLPIAHISEGGAVSWFSFKAIFEAATLDEWVYAWGPLLLAALALISMRMGWLARALLLVLVPLLRPIAMVVEHVSLLRDDAFEVPPTNEIVGLALYALIAGFGICLIPAVAHRRKRALAGGSYRTMMIAALAVLLMIALRYVFVDDLYGYADLIGSEQIFLADAVPLIEWVLYLLFLVLAVVTGMRASARGNRWVSSCSRMALLALFLWRVPFYGIAEGSITWEQLQAVLVIAVGEGAIDVTDMISGGLAAASFLHWRAARRAANKLRAFD